MQQGPYPPSGEQPSYPTYPSYPTPQQPAYGAPPQPYYDPGQQQYQQPYGPPQQQPYYMPPQQQPQPYGYGAPGPVMQATYTRNTSFTNKAVVAFLLYFLGWVPGFIFNLMYLNEANNVKKELGRDPEGIGCLWATLIGSLVPLAVFALCALWIIAAIGYGGATQH